jgi:hypothetical protein
LKGARENMTYAVIVHVTLYTVLLPALLAICHSGW